MLVEFLANVYKASKPNEITVTLIKAALRVHRQDLHYYLHNLQFSICINPDKIVIQDHCTEDHDDVSFN